MYRARYLRTASHIMYLWHLRNVFRTSAVHGASDAFDTFSLLRKHHFEKPVKQDIGSNKLVVSGNDQSLALSKEHAMNFINVAYTNQHCLMAWKT